jgi:hypothetical protein
MYRCEIERSGACQRESSSLEAEPLRVAKANAGAARLHARLACGNRRKTSGVAFCSTSPQGVQISSPHHQGNSNTIWRLRSTVPSRPASGSASSKSVKSPNIKAVQGLLQSSPARKGSARPNHSVNLRANGIARRPAAAHSTALHSAAAGHRAMPLAPGYLER